MCVFCQIVKGDIPAYKVYEDEKNLAFLDIRPVNPGHILVIAKRHFINLEEIPSEDLAELILVVQKMGRLIKEKLGYEGYNVSENNDPVAGQEIPHLHFHVIPRIAGDGHVNWPHSSYKPGETEEILRRMLN